MDVPFISSGAISRAHYSVVRKVELASSVQHADQDVALEIKHLHERLVKSSLDLKECKECLIILLYCAMTVTSGFLPKNAFDFALPHALNLAEAGKTIDDKRIGYLFCTEIMPPDHELRLMMVNTLRKDLESSNIPRICLALDNIISCSNDDIIPAVQSTLHDLLSHNYPHIRRRAIFAFRALSVFEPQLLTRVSGTIVKRLKDPNDSVGNAALIAAMGIPTSDPNFSRIRVVLNTLLPSVDPPSKPSNLFRVLQCLHTVGMTDENLSIALQLVRSSAKTRQSAALLGLFRLLSQQTPSKLALEERVHGTSSIRQIQDYLTSQDPNHQYLYLQCLHCLDPVIWAGLSRDQFAVLEGWEVELVMQFLDSPDSIIRRTTLIILDRIDPSIVSTYFSRTLEAIPSGLNIASLNTYTTGMLDVIEIQSEGDGEKYAHGVKAIFDRASSSNVIDRPRVLEDAVEKVLVLIRASNNDFRILFATTLLTLLVDSPMPLGPTFMVIASALSTEYRSSTSISPNDLLRAFCESLKISPPNVQNTSLVAMICLIAECDDLAVQPAIQAVEGLRQRAGRHIQRRCDQLLRYSQQRPLLRAIIQSARSSSLPDFLEALEQPSKPVSPEPPFRDSSTPSNKLRYAAYAPPQPVMRLWPVRAASPHGSSRSFRSDGGSERGVERENSHDSLNAVTLSLAAVSLGLELERKVSAKSLPMIASTEIHKPDLITLDSPFVPESNTEEISSSGEFKKVWDTIEESKSARGWCDSTVDVLLRRLQRLDRSRLQIISIDLPPFIGELKILLSTIGTQTAVPVAIRLRESDEESCLWRLRGEDEDLRRLVKNVLNEES